MNLKKKTTIVTNFRGRVEDIATIALFMTEKGMIPRSLAEVVKFAVESVSTVIVRERPLLEVTSTTQATDILSSFGLLDLRKKFRGKASLVSELSLESLTSGEGKILNSHKSEVKKEQKSQGGVSNAFVHEALDNLKSRIANDRKTITKEHNALSLIPDNMIED